MPDPAEHRQPFDRGKVKSIAFDKGSTNAKGSIKGQAGESLQVFTGLFPRGSFHVLPLPLGKTA